MTFNLASAWEAVSDVLGDEDAVICGDQRRSWTEFETRAARVAGALRAAGIAVSLFLDPDLEQIGRLADFTFPDTDTKVAAVVERAASSPSLFSKCQ